MNEHNLFVEQAEYIEIESLQKWSIDHPDEAAIIQKLAHGGAKLITGPRGCGKTTLLLKAFYKLCGDHRFSALPIYVNFKSSLKLEPIYKKNANAVFWFNQWLLFKVYAGLFETLKVLKVDCPGNLRFDVETVDRITSQLELGLTDFSIDDTQLLTVSVLEDDIKKVLEQLNKQRCVLLLDDAAHAFSSEQQRDFFDFFRQIKSRVLSPKAAIYPGVTTYSAAFHVGHDAEEIDVWVKPDSNSYTSFMVGLLERRLPTEVYMAMIANDDLLKLVCYASFGMPRALLNMVRTFYKDSSDDGHAKISFDRRTVLRAVKSTIESSLSIYKSLKFKLPIYENFITTGERLYSKIIENIKDYNKGKDVNHQSVTIAIRQPVPAELSKVLGFFQYSGLLLPKGEISRGEKGVFELYVVHYAALLDRNALMGQKAINIATQVEALRKRNAHEFTRISPSVLAGKDNLATLFSLSLPPCQVCKTPRINESAKFCLNCGTQLKTSSVFETLVSQDIKFLPLTKRRVDTIRGNSRIRIIKDILMDSENRELRGVPQIGPYWAKRIYSYAEEYIA